MTDETRLAEELGRRADDVHGTPLSVHDVRRTARRIRRRRRTAAVTAVAAAVAVVAIAPHALSGGSGGGRHPSPAPPVAPQRPGASVLHDGTLTLPDDRGTVPIDVDNARVSQVGVLTDGRIVLAMQKPYAVRVYGPDGSLLQQHPVQSNVITMSPLDDAVAWVGEDYRTMVLASGSGEPAALPGIPAAGESAGSIDAVLDPEHVLVGDFGTTTGEVTPDGYATRTFSEPLRVTDVSPDGHLWAVQYADDADPQYGCAGLYDPEQDRMVARSCDTAGLTFAPDGEHLLGMLADNNTAGDVTTYDLHLEPVGGYAPSGDGDAISRAAWSDPSHLLVSVAGVDDSRWSLASVGLDGSPEGLVVPERPGRNPEGVAEFLLSE